MCVYNTSSMWPTQHRTTFEVYMLARSGWTHATTVVRSLKKRSFDGYSQVGTLLQPKASRKTLAHFLCPRFKGLKILQPTFSEQKWTEVYSMVNYRSLTWVTSLQFQLYTTTKVDAIGSYKDKYFQKYSKVIL